MSASDKLGIREFDEMVSDTLESIVNKDVGITNTSVGSVVRTLVEAILDNVDASNYYTSYIYDAMGIDEATGDDLDRLVYILGIVREKASPATGVVTFSTGDAPYEYDIQIPYGYQISTRQLSDGTIHIFTVDEYDVVLKAGQTSIDVKVVCDETGHLYLPAGSINTMSTSIVGVSTVINKTEINSGSDKESDEDFRVRAKDYVASLGKCTNDALKVAIQNIEGINACTVIDQYQGPGTSAVLVVPQIIPVLPDISSVVDKVVASTKASGIKVFIIYPTIKFINIVCTITGVTIEDPSILLEALSNYTSSLEVGQTFVIRQMERKLLNALDNNSIDNDDVDIITETPTSNVTCGSEEIIRVKTITINGEVYNV